MNSNSRTIYKNDPLLFLWYNESDELIGYILVHIDDFLSTGNQGFHKTIITKLRGKFLIGKEDKLNFKYLGPNVTATNSTITLNINTDRKNEVTSPLNKAEKDQLRAKIGQLLWISNQTMPDISFDVSTLASNLNNATVNETLYCNKIISKVYHNSYQLNYMKINREQKIVVGTDTSCENLKNSESEGVHLTFLMGENNFCDLLSWHSKQLKRAAQGLLTAETIALLNGVESAFYMKELFKELYKTDLPV